MNRVPGHLPRPVLTTSSSPRLKILTLGEPNVGKSCIVKRYCEERFIQDYVSTIGIDYGVKTTNVTLQDGRKEECKINFWDVAGDPTYYEVRNEFYKDTQGIVLVFDVGLRSTFDALTSWLEELQGSVQFENTVVFVVGNKTDLLNREVTTEEGRTWATERNFGYAETSCQNGTNIKATLEDLFAAVLLQLLGPLPAEPATGPEGATGDGNGKKEQEEE